MPIPTIRFTQEQARTLAGVSTGDLRQWRKAVPYLAAKPGKAARFTFADLVALSVTRDLITTFGVHISTVGRSIDSLFRTLAEARSAHLKGALVLISTDNASIIREAELADRPINGPVLVVPCDPLVSRMAEQLLPRSTRVDRDSLPFRPQAIRRGV